VLEAIFGAKAAKAEGRVAPGPRAFPLVGHLPFFLAPGRLTRHLRDAEVYGDVVRYHFGRSIGHMVRHPDHVKYVLQDNQANYRKGRGGDKLRPLLGNGLGTSEGDFWRRQRRLAAPAFHKRRLEALFTTMVRETAAFVEGWRAKSRSGVAFDVAPEMARLTLTIVAKALFGSDLREHASVVGDSVTVAFRHATGRVLSLIDLPLSLPTPGNLRMRRALEALDGVVYGVIKERRKSGVVEDDLLGMLMQARDEETGESMSDTQLRDEVTTIIIAGYETTATALSWAWYLLFTHPSERRKLEAELEAWPRETAPMLADLERFPFSRMIVEETMRLYPPAWAIGRRAVEDDEIGGFTIAAGSPLLLSPYVTHRHPAFWENPEAFDPDRFAPAAAAKRPRYAYFPFGGGPRVCIGNSFALMEAQVVVAMIASRYRLEVVSGQAVEPEPLITLRPKGGIWVVARERPLSG
jgi:cytochrome P450